MSPELVLERLCKRYNGNVDAVEDLTLRVNAGEFFVLLGPSGSGKTTTLRLAAGLETPTSGEVYLGGRRVTREPPHRRHAAMVFQRPALYPHLSVREHLFEEIASEETPEVEELAEAMGLTPLMERRPAELSGGEKQRVALARALGRRPGLLLLDEPLASLDPPQRLTCRRLLAEVQDRRQTTTLYVTHDQEEALALGDRVAVLHRGVIQQIDKPSGLYYRPRNRFVACFIGSPAMQMLEGRLTRGDQGLELVGEGVKLLLPGNFQQPWAAFRDREVAIGVRPEQVKVPPDRTGGAHLEMEVEGVLASVPQPLVLLRRGTWSAAAHWPTLPYPVQRTTVKVEISPRREYLFDMRTGEALAEAS
jgi:multiple sugar transport system ATP-binding protein